MRTAFTLSLVALSGSLSLMGCGQSTPTHQNPTAVARAAAAAESARPDPGQLRHPVSTKNAAAQRAFDEGLTMVYAFNHEDAARAFRRSAAADPNLAMAQWGIALALGPNYNETEIAPERAKKAYEAIQQAIALSKDAPEQERAYIAALAKRYSEDPKADAAQLNAAYLAAMRELSKRYPDDLDAATLYADAGMNVRPWKLYTADARPVEGTDEIVATLESVLRRDPNHIGANHLYIHAVEASTHPERALEAAARLPALAPDCGHLVHMPSHVYNRTGDYVAAAGSNEVAVAVDEKWLKATEDPHGTYGMMYYSHNLHFLSVASAMAGRYAAAKQAADRLEAHVSPHLAAMPMLQGFVPTPTLILVKFRRWDDVLRLPEPDRSMAGVHAVWHFARGMAYAGTGKPDQAMAEHKALLAETAAIPADAMFSPWNKAHSVLAIADDVLAAKIAAAHGDAKTASNRLRAAGVKEDALSYIEPPDWYLFPRQSLGAVLLSAGDAAGSEQAFREELDRHPRSGRALFGLVQSLRAQGKTYDADFVQSQFDTAWRDADTKLTLQDL